jgi:hypothetical protein
MQHFVRGVGAAARLWLAPFAAFITFATFAGASVGAAASCSGRIADPPGNSGSSSNDGTDGGYGGSFPAVEAPAPIVGDEAASAPPNPGDDASDDADAGPPAPIDAGSAAPSGACASPLSPGDLTIDEIMIESVAGAGDDGEWFEVASTLDCTANLNGLHGECPRGSKVATFDVTGDTWLAPHGTFVVADSLDPAINHRLPGLVLVWLGHPGDVLRNQGSTITLSRSGSLLDTVTYPSLRPAVGASVAFPDGCDAALRSDFTHWKRSTASWFPGFFGTPNAPNVDVECP